MITKDICLSILVRLGDEGHDVNSLMTKLLLAPDLPIDVLKFIVEHNGIHVNEFYEMLRRKHNESNSRLYINLVNEELPENEVLSTASCLLTQIILFGKKLGEADTFYQEARADEVTGALNDYFVNGNLERIKLLLQAVRADLLVLEYLAGRRALVDE